jgi:hypothetical protein
VSGGEFVIDNRANKVIDHEIDDALKDLSDTEVLINFQKAIISCFCQY